MTTAPRTKKIPAPIYAAAGAGDLAYQHLRRLPDVLDQLRTKAATGSAELRGKANTGGADLRERARTTTAELRGRAVTTLRNANTKAEALRTRAVGDGELDVQRLREAARRNAAVVAAGAQVAQDRALAAYAALVARGERVVGTGVVQAADTVNADMTATEAPAQVTATPSDLAGTVSATDTPSSATSATDTPTSVIEAPAADAPTPKPAKTTKSTRASRTGAAPTRVNPAE